MGFLKYSVTVYSKDPMRYTVDGVNYRYAQWISARKQLRDSMKQGHYVVMHRYYPLEEGLNLEESSSSLSSGLTARVYKESGSSNSNSYDLNDIMEEVTSSSYF